MEYTVTMFVNATPCGLADIVNATRVDLTCDYTAGRPDVMYMCNGDPGDPGDPAEISLVSVAYNGVRLADDHPLTVLLMCPDSPGADVITSTM